MILTKKTDFDQETFRDAHVGTTQPTGTTLELVTEMRKLTEAISSMKPSMPDTHDDVSEHHEDETSADDNKSQHDDEIEKIDIEPGMDKEAKELYRRERYHDWEEMTDLPEDDDEKYKKHALVVRRERDPEGGNVLLH